jgi:DNA-binding transcriptional ArsR family regulator
MSDPPDSRWLFLTSHGAALLSVAGNPAIDVGELALLLGVEEPAAEEILEDLLAEGFIIRRRQGPRTRYDIDREAHFRHPFFADVEIGPLIDALQAKRAGSNDGLR